MRRGGPARGATARAGWRFPIEYLASNLTAFDPTLGADDMTALKGLDRGGRMIDPAVPHAWD
jgi:hypothetical protein